MKGYFIEVRANDDHEGAPRTFKLSAPFISAVYSTETVRKGWPVTVIVCAGIEYRTFASVGEILTAINKA